MGAAAGQRGAKRIAQAIQDDYNENHIVEFEIMDRLNGIKKNPLNELNTHDRDVFIEYDKIHKVWWVIDVLRGYDGFGYYYKTINFIMKNWNIEIHSYDATKQRYIASPIKEGNK